MRIEHKTVTIDAVVWQPPHGAQHQQLVDELVESMRARGWVGRPIPISCPSGELDAQSWAWTGSHRAEAVRRLIEERGCVEVDLLMLIAEDQRDRVELEMARCGARSEHSRRLEAKMLADVYPCCQALVEALEEEHAAFEARYG